MGAFMMDLSLSFNRGYAIGNFLGSVVKEKVVKRG
jgi:hypothetical protein